jgi:hypothetical protein
MAYIIGCLTPAEAAELEQRGWELEPAPSQLVDAANAETMKMAWVDADMFAIMNGADWDRGET